MSEALHPEGKYKAKITPNKGYRQGRGKDDQPGAWSYLVEFELLEGPAAGTTMLFDAGLEGARAEYGTKALQAMGMVGNDPETIEVGRVVEVVIKHDTYKFGKLAGQKYVKIGFVNALGGGTGARPDAATIERLKRGITAAIGGKPASEAVAATGTDDGFPDDPGADSPFGP